MKGKLTAREIAALRPSVQAQRIEIDIGLQLRIAPDGEKIWVVRYRVKGRQRDYRLPKPYGATTDESHLSLADARGEAAAIRILARQGIDIQVQEEERRAAEVKLKEDSLAAEQARILQEQRENLTFQAMYDAWLADGVRRKNDNIQLKRSFNADVLPKVGSRPVRELTEHELRAILRAVVDRGANRAAVILRNDLTQAFSWAEKRQPWRKLLIEGNPMDLIEIDKIVSPEYDFSNQRERILSESEILPTHNLLFVSHHC